MGILGNWLPEDPQQNAAARQGLLALGGAMMSAKGNNFLGTLGQGLLAGGEGYQGALQQQQQQQLMATQQKRWELENRETQAKLDEPMAIAALLGPAAGSGGSNAAPSFSSAPQMSAPATPGAPAGPVGPAAGFGQPRPPEQQYAQLMDYANRLTQSGRVAQAKVYYDMADRLRPKLKETRAQTDANNNRMMVNYFEDGSHAIVKDVLPDAEKLNFQNTGASTVGLDPFTGKPVSTITNTLSPGQKAEIEQRERERRSAEERARAERAAKAPPGYRWAADGQSLEAIPGGPVTAKTTEVQQKVSDAQSVLGLLEMAEPLVTKATSSYGGVAVDQAARLVGASTSSGEAAAQLKAIEGSLISKMPKMSGPQSDKDVLLYRQMAGQIGDPTIPAANKQAAMKVIREINQRYLNQVQPQAVRSIKDLPKKQPTGIPPGWTVKEK